MNYRISYKFKASSTQRLHTDFVYCMFEVISYFIPWYHPRLISQHNYFKNALQQNCMCKSSVATWLETAFNSLMPINSDFKKQNNPKQRRINHFWENLMQIFPAQASALCSSSTPNCDGVGEVSLDKGCPTYSPHVANSRLNVTNGFCHRILQK